MEFRVAFLILGSALILVGARGVFQLAKPRVANRTRLLWPVGLGLIGALMLSGVLLFTPPWARHADTRTIPAAARAPVPQESDTAAAAGRETSDMLKMARTAFIACGAPAAPSDIPDGATATREQMIAAHATVKAYDQATTIYTECVDTTAYQANVQFKAVATSADTEALGILQTQLHNAAIDRDQALANRFNVQLRRFKARAPK